MSDAREILEKIVNGFSVGAFVGFFRNKSAKFGERREALNQYNDENFKEGERLGEIIFTEAEQLAVFAFQAGQPLSERSGKKAQYEKGKKILKERQYDAGIFIFYDNKGSFRLSLIYANYLGKRRDWSVFRRFTYFVSGEFTNKTFLQRIGDGDLSSLEKIKEAFSVEKVTKEFYEDIANWYFWAVEHCKFPTDAEVEEGGRNVAVIRLITRMIFIWFMRERGLVPKDLFEEKNILAVLKNTNPENSTYYRAILQNLFFATLSTKKEERQFRSKIRGHKGYNPDFGNQYVYRYHNLFASPGKIKDYFGDIPFLNGGLFECLDDGKNDLYIDGFTERKKEYQPEVPNFLFFSGEKKADLNSYYGTRSKAYKVRGLLNILSSFNFTIDENSPDDADIALDPELLGRVFENLLASFNPETSTTARKATGSYYTPREIVDYMVAESLKAYFKTHLSEIKNLDEKLEDLFSIGRDENPFNKSESKKLVELIESVRIVDLAVGSGAFPMGALNKMVFILGKVDPGNELWKQVQLDAAETIPDPQVRRAAKNQIVEFFKDKNADYGRKLYLIQKCIYGVDIQQIAVEIAKLRFFISLLVDEKIDKTKENWGIEPLPNLDFKIMQGNSLISEFLGIDFDNGQEKQERAGLLFTEGDDNLIKEFEQKKINFQNESDKKKKDDLKDEVENLMIKIFETKIKKQKADYFRQLEAMEKNKFLEGLSKKVREEIITKEKQKLSQKTGFDLENIEKQLREFTGKNKTKPFFPWKLYFAEVFEKDGFDVVIANPPYVRADSPDFKAQRGLIMQSKRYETLYEKWDLFVPFIERGLKLLSNSGNLSYITSNSLLTSKFAFRLLEFIQNSYATQYIDYFSDDTKVFEAGVVPVVFGIASQAVNPNVRKTIHQGEFNHIIRQEIIPITEFKSLGKEAFKLSINSFKSTTKTISLGDICYLSYGLRPNSDERFWRGEFTRDDLVSDVKDKEHPVQYIEGKNLDYYRINNILYLEWGTDRVPKKLVRQTFPELYEKPKLLRGTMTGGTYDDSGVVCNHSIVVIVRFIDLKGVENKSISVSLKKFNSLPRTELEKVSTEFDLKYLLAILNSKFANHFLNGIRRHRLENYFYPDDFRKLPIADVSLKKQKPFVDFVYKILAITKDSDYPENSAKQAKVRDYEKQIDQLVYKLYTLTTEEIKIVESTK
ncbi:MAG: TaqI-like C-terminal specificity domain-containing protein [bacterium]|nr:TaqI-like C-terminal specificity domain-containing protein [bacterium]